MRRLQRLLSLLLVVLCLICSCFSLSANAFSSESGSFIAYKGFNYEDWMKTIIEDHNIVNGFNYRYCFSTDKISVTLEKDSEGNVKEHFYRVTFDEDGYYDVFFCQPKANPPSSSNSTRYNFTKGSSMVIGNVDYFYTSSTTPFRPLASTPLKLIVCTLPTPEYGILDSIRDGFANLWQWLQNIVNEIKEIPNKIGEFITKLGDRIEGFFVKLVEDIKGLFVPDDEFMEEYKNKWSDWFDEHFGAVSQIFDFFDDTFEQLGSISPTDSPSLTLPAIDIPVNGKTFHLMDEHSYSFDFINTSPWSTLYGIYKSFVYVILFLLLANYAYKVYEKIVNH